MTRKILSLASFVMFSLLTNVVMAEPTNTYDSQGRVIKTVYDNGSYDTYYYYSNGSGYKHTYDSAGRNTGYYNYNSAEDFENNTPYHKTLMTYDENGNQILSESYDNDVMTSKWTNEYDEEKNVWVSESYNSSESIESGKPDYYGIYSQETGENVGYDKDGNLDSVGGYVLEYDDQGNIIAFGWELC